MNEKLERKDDIKRAKKRKITLDQMIAGIDEEVNKGQHWLMQTQTRRQQEKKQLDSKQRQLVESIDIFQYQNSLIEYLELIYSQRKRQPIFKEQLPKVT